jgi:hypothetical protein
MRLSRRRGQPHATIGYVNHKPLIVMWPPSWLSYMFISYKSLANHNVSSFFWVKSAFSYAFPYAFPMVPMTFLGAQDGHPGRRSPGASAFPWTTPVTTWTAKLPGGDGCPMSW